MLSIYSFFHVISAVIWVGGMFFAYSCLRPAAGTLLEPPQRLSLWVAVFKRFFPYVWLAVLLLPTTGYLMMFAIWNGFANAPIYVHLMNSMGIIMLLIYMHVYFAPYKRLKLAVNESNWPVGAKALAQIRILVGVNTVIGLLVIIVASAGRFYI